MKRNVRKLLSLVLVVVMLLGVMVPGALAAGTDTGTGTNTNNMGILICLFSGKHTYVSNGVGGYVCRYCGTAYTPTTTPSINYRHEHQYIYYDKTYHTVSCSEPTCEYNTNPEYAYIEHTGNPCTYCNNSYGYSTENYLQWTNEYCTANTTDHTHYAVYDASVGYYCWYCRTTPIGYGTGTVPSTADIQWSTVSCAHNSTTGTHTPVWYSTSNGIYYYYCSNGECNAFGTSSGTTTGTGTGTVPGTTTGIQWNLISCDYNQVSHSHTPAYSTTYNGVHYYYCSNGDCPAFGMGTGTTTGTGYGSDYAVGTGGLLYVYASDTMTNDVYTPNSNVALYVTPYLQSGAAGSLAEDYIITYSWSGATPTVTDNSIAYPDTTGSYFYASCTVTLTSKTDPTKTDSATVSWYATAQVGNSILYSSLSGQNVKLNAEDFQQFWNEQYPNGTLSYVRFTSVSSGNLYDNYSSTKRTDVRAYNTSCYLTPAYNQVGLDDLTYVPSAYSSTGTVTIQFVAQGTSGSTFGSLLGTNYGSASLTGTITILYTAKEVTPITYDAAGDKVALKSADFTNKYKEVMGVNYSGNLTIQFLEVPVYGTLTMSYGTNYWQQNNGTVLTAANIDSFSFSTAATATYSIDDLTYTPGKAADTIRFACYSGTQLKFVGTVTFGSSQQYTVTMDTTAGKAVALSLNAFRNADSTGLLTSGYVTFGTPSVGTLYKNYANGTGTRLTASDYFNSVTLSSVTYVPPTAYVGISEIPFTASTYTGTQISGVLKIFVGRNFTDVLGTASEWAAPYINQLSAQGIVNGTGTGTTYSPTKTVTWGEALKLIMMAAGYPEQAKTSTHWASGYLSKAYYDGLIPSNKSIDLNSTVTRNDIAELTAKALKLTPASYINAGITGPTDSTNTYVYAVYNAGIINGVNQNGKNYFLGSNNITRAEISKIICMVSDYEA